MNLPGDWSNYSHRCGVCGHRWHESEAGSCPTCYDREEECAGCWRRFDPADLDTERRCSGCVDAAEDARLAAEDAAEEAEAERAYRQELAESEADARREDAADARREERRADPWAGSRLYDD